MAVNKINTMFGINHTEKCIIDVISMEIRKQNKIYLYLTLKANFSMKKLCTSMNTPQEITTHFTAKEMISIKFSISRDNIIIKTFLNKLASHIAIFNLLLLILLSNRKPPFKNNYEKFFILANFYNF